MTFFSLYTSSLSSGSIVVVESHGRVLTSLSHGETIIPDRSRGSRERRCRRALGPSRAYSQAWMPLLQPSCMSVARQSPVHQDQLSRGQNRGQNRDAEFFYGCNNATTKSANSKAVTRNDRYLAIATCGGLNQQ
ncbi:Uncharacterized protein Rs2_43820 [Raphanus sativus]|nr:Uncharacterized protein Rs2_43820 [Raphanus sativus]